MYTFTIAEYLYCLQKNVWNVFHFISNLTIRVGIYSDSKIKFRDWKYSVKFLSNIANRASRSPAGSENIIKIWHRCQSAKDFLCSIWKYFRDFKTFPTLAEYLRWNANSAISSALLCRNRKFRLRQNCAFFRYTIADR